MKGTVCELTARLLSVTGKEILNLVPLWYMLHDAISAATSNVFSDLVSCYLSTLPVHMGPANRKSLEYVM